MMKRRIEQPPRVPGSRRAKHPKPADPPGHPTIVLPSLEQMQVMLRLANDLHRPVDVSGRTHRLLAGLLRPIDASAAACAWVRVGSSPIEMKPVGAVGAGRRRPSNAAVSDEMVDDATLSALLRHPPTTMSPAVRERRELLNGQLARPGAIPPLPTLYSLCRPDGEAYASAEDHGGWLSLLIVTRIEPRPFENREATILRLMHPQTVWAVPHPSARPTATETSASSRASTAAAARSRLPRRAGDVLDLMLAGHSEKEIARRVGRSPHTVHTHIKRVYRHFSVASRAELLARFVR